MSKPRAKAKPAAKDPAPWAAWNVEPRPIDSLIAEAA